MDYEKLSDRELDALFAEKVLGFEAHDYEPAYTHSLDAAWEGVEKLRSERGYEFNVWWNTEGEDRGVGYSPKEMRELGSTSGECRVYVEGWTDDGESAFGEFGNNELAVADHPARALVISCLKAVEAK